MSLRINDTAPNFKAESTHGPIDFHNWMGDQWVVFFPHPKNFTPVCTTELGYLAREEAQFTLRNAKLIGLSVDPVTSHEIWAVDIEETQGAKVNYPLIGDADLAVSKLYNMLPADEPGTSDGRTAANNTNSALKSLIDIVLHGIACSLLNKPDVLPMSPNSCYPCPRSVHPLGRRKTGEFRLKLG